jgi:predicted dehydrogenase
MSYQRDFARRVRTALIGVGSHAYRNLLPVLTYLPVELRAVCAKTNKERAEYTASQYGCRAYIDVGTMLEEEDIEAVLICLPPAVQADVAVQVLSRGKHVWLEKPPGITSLQIEEMIASRGDSVAVVGFKKAFMPVTDKAIEIAGSPEYGNLNSILAIYPTRIPGKNEPPDPTDKVQDWLLNGVHPISFALAVGGDPVSVQALTGKNGHGSCCIRFRDGVIANLHLASGPMPMESYYLFGDKWHLDIYNNNRISLHRGIPMVYGKTTEFVAPGDDSGAVVWEASNCHASLENKALFTQGIFRELQYFFECILEGKKPQRGSLEFALQVMRVYEGAIKSAGHEVVL